MSESFLHQHIESFLKFRRQMGHRIHDNKFQFNLFERELIRRNIHQISEIDSQFVHDHAFEILKTRSPGTVNRHMTILENFFCYLQRVDLTCLNPFLNRTMFRSLYFRPYVFSDDEVKSILQSFASDISKSRNRDFLLGRLSRRCAFFIQANCGLRVSELSNLKRKDVDLAGATLLIEKTKFQKDRLIPISQAVVSEIRNYLEVKSQSRRQGSKYLLVSATADSFTRLRLGVIFQHKLIQLGIYRKPYMKGDTVFGSPSTHSLRHTFTIRIVQQWKARGIPIDQVSDTLATYLGHIDFEATQVYLKALSTDPGFLIFRPKSHE
ncbi:MAG: hypothetical protein A2X86_12875 [Bdellovibrionales bacterium GWA2_49_15]|nr:MAG: hypothetical protein A2X86_12875 [Bdellovibrionales bacterium GWA2_49_15]